MLVRDELAQLLLQEVSDPSLRGLAVAGVRLTGDLSEATVRLSYPEGANQKAIAQGLKRATPFIRRQLGQRLQLRHVPALEFKPDTETESVVRVLGLIDEMGAARAAARSGNTRAQDTRGEFRA